MITLARLIGISAGAFLGVILPCYATAKMSDVLGDRYPRMQGRLTVKPKAHSDPVGSLGVPAVFLFLSLIGQPIGMFFAYGKAIPNSFRALRSPKRDQVLIGLAGPATNLALAYAAGAAGSRLLTASSTLTSTAGAALVYLMSVNVFIFIVNVFPLPPLAGSRVLMPFLSSSAQFRLQEYSRYLILLLVVLFFLRISLGINILGAMTSPLCRLFTGTVGICPL